MSYIYQIRNVDNGRRYIGQTKNLKHRRNCHIYDLRHGKHRSKLMQADYNENPEAFVFEVVCECSNEDLRELEIFFISKYDTVASGYNASPGQNPNGGNIFTEDTKAKISESKMGNASMKGIRLSDEWRRHLAEAQPHKKRILCVETNETFESFADAARKTGLNRTKIVSVCTGKRKTTGGLHFRYADKQEEREASA